MFDWKKPTVEMLGRWQPWHDGHTALFKKALEKTGQVCIMYRDVGGVDAGVAGQNDNPFQFEEVKRNSNDKPGTINQLDKTGLYINTIDSVVVITYLQFPNKKIIT